MHTTGVHSAQKNHVIAVIQARMGSTRLPGKALLDLSGRPLLYHVISRARAIKGINEVVLATCVGDDNIPIINLAESMGIGVYIGSVRNVLERFYRASEKFGGSWVVRITADNPFTDPAYASEALEFAIENNADLATISGIPLGTAVEVIKKQALDRAYHAASEPYHYEHVTPYIKEHAELFRIMRKPAAPGPDVRTMRLTVDTAEDYSLAQKIYENLYKGDIFSLQQVMDFLHENPDVAAINNGITQRPMTEAHE